MSSKFNPLSASELIGAPTLLEYLPRLSDHPGAKFLSNVMIRRRWRWGETNCASWSFSPPMRCAKGRILCYRRRDPV